MRAGKPLALALSFTKNSPYNFSVGTSLQIYVYIGQSVLTGMIAQHFRDAQSWAAENFGSAQLGHKRRTQRLLVTARQIADQPEGSLPSKFSWNPLRAVYRLCNRPEVTHREVTAPHFRLTHQRMNQPDPVLILHDTTELDFTAHAALRGTGPIGDGGGRGFLQHNSLAIHAETGEVLGLAFQQIVTRQPCSQGESRTPTAHAWRESQLWTQGFQGVGPAPEGTCWVDVADRGADTFEAMQTALNLGHHFLFRATQDRKIRQDPEPTDQAAYLKRLARSLPAPVSSTVEVPGRGGRPARTAQVHLAATKVWIQVPAIWKGRHPEWKPIPVWVERAWEPEPPVEIEEPLEWILLSSLPAETEAELLQRQAWYERRPLIEDFHQVEKTGCGEEALRFETAAAMLPMLGVLSVVAVRILQLRWWGRQHGRRRPQQRPRPRNWRWSAGLGHHVETARDFVHAVAKLGGFLGRRRDGEPGWKTLWRGYQRLQDMVLGLKLNGTAARSRDR